MTPEEFLKKWTEPAARGLKVLPENLRMKGDLDNVIRGILTIEEYQWLLDRRDQKAAEERMREFDENFL